MTSTQASIPSLHHQIDQPTPSPEKKTRIEWIDIAKGIGIVLVSFGHLRNGDGQSVWLPALDGLISVIYLFHMPLFYLLGGLTFSMRGGFKSFIIRKVKTLLVPYYVFSLYFLAKPFAILLIPSLRDTFQTTHDYGIAQQFYDVLIAGNGLWFLMAFFVGEIIMYGLVTLVGNRKPVLMTIGMLLVTGSFCRLAYLPNFQLPFQLLTGIEVAGFMCLGYVLRDWFKQLKRTQALRMCLIAFLLFFAISSLAINNYVPIVVYWIVPFLAAIFGSSAVIFLCVVMHSDKLFVHIGRNSLVYYALNALTLNIVKLVVFRLLKIDASSWEIPNQLVTGIAITIIAIALLSIENIFIQRYMRWAIGKTSLGIPRKENKKDLEGGGKIK